MITAALAAVMTILPLSKYPQYSPLLAHWAFFQWYHQRNVDFKAVEADYRRRADFTALPVSWLVMEKNIPVGMVSLKAHDLNSHAHLTPWLSALYVVPEFRKKGFAGKLIETVAAYAKCCGYHQIYLFTDNKNASYLSRYYIERGWTLHEKVSDADGMEVEVLTLLLD